MIRDQFKDVKKVTTKEVRKKAALGERAYYSKRINRLQDLKKSLGVSMIISTVIIGIAYVWTGFLLFFGMMVVHDYTIGKNILTTIASIVGMAFIMFIGILFSGLITKVFSFVYNIYIELSYR